MMSTDENLANLHLTIYIRSLCRQH